MSYERRTCVSGETAEGKRVWGSLCGHWKPESALRWARRMGAGSAVEIEHTVFDHSGRGSGGHDGRWLATRGDEITRIEEGK